MANKPESSEEYVSGEQFEQMRRSHSSSGKKVTVPIHTIALVASVVVLCILSFAGGMAYQKHHGKSPALTAAASTNGASPGAGGGSGFSGRRGSGGIGQVTAISPTSITVSNQRTNANMTYAITSSTMITDNGQTVTPSDITTSDTVLITTSSTDTSTATRILVNPSFGGGGFGGQGGQTAPGGSAPGQSN